MGIWDFLMGRVGGVHIEEALLMERFYGVMMAL